ncbi:citrate lyase subunit beta/citryl-CoA lyase [Microbacterium terrae]|uniref:HpcH/HpaI aldolase/citrate lyase family protein n=1 Tax=Microbacterium terrae TaxID=69369 RepID=UPI001B3A956E|nr:CoA ester lyase [Microbacterium terrae]MBP1077471.1 citrate lyase subunit beta/citryl-CoA lyase [Microbacterium terrae]GLJ99077.1 CoA ester lyase [Microbacterium terrae]
MTFTLGPALLFCPADRPERYAKAAERADAVILDLEDAVAPADKAAARGALIESELDPARVIVRVNPPETDAFVADLSTLSQTDYRRIMVAKAQSPKRLGRIDARFEVIALCETAKGVAQADRIAELANVSALMWGAEDLVASIGGTSSRKPNGRYRDIARYARSRVLLAAAARGKAAIDAVHLDIADTKRLGIEAADAAASGFTATACIHPSQVAIIRDAYLPDARSLAWARAVLTAAEGERGVFRHDGRMVDEPVLRHARSLVARAGD